MSGNKTFVDTNVLVYMYDSHDPTKRNTALKLVSELRRSRQIALSPQVLREFYSAVTRKLGVSETAALQAVKAFSTVTELVEDADLVVQGVEAAHRHQLAFRDGLIVASARRSGAARLYSEDLNPGQIYDGVEVINPFT